jgi:NADH-quinone oxidoreductase subunit M
MTLLDQLLLLSIATVALTAMTGRMRLSGWIATILYAGQFLVLVKMPLPVLGPELVTASTSLTLFEQQMIWRFDSMSWFFALITVGAALLSSWYAAGEWGKKFRQQGGKLWLLHLALSLNVFSMLLLLASGDFLSLFIAWELVSWAGFLLMAMAGGSSIRSAMHYMTYAMAGAMAIFAGLGLVYVSAGSLQFSDFIAALPDLSSTKLWVLLALFGIGFSIKMGLLPFHLWQAAAYAQSPGPGAAFLGSISSRMGLYAVVVVLIQLIGLARIAELEIALTFLDAREVLLWIAAFSIIFPTFTALRQSDATRLLAWHGIGQGGYMMMGVMIGDAMGSAGGLMHVFNHATYQAALFFSVFAVVHRTGTSDLNQLGGLITRMPLSFITMLIGIIGLAGMPPMNGFVSKWLVYRSLMLEGMPLLFIATVIGTLGTILSVYKLIHNMFLGQLRVEHFNIREVPWSMTLPMLILSLIVFVTGFMPGLVLQWVAAAQTSVGLPALVYSMGGVESDSGSLDMIWVVGVMLAGFAISAVLFYSGGKSKAVHQLDNYAGGHFLTADIRYQYSDNFYAGLMRHIGPWYRSSFQWLESAIRSWISFFSMGAHSIFRTAHPETYLLATSVVALAWVIL